MGRYLRGGASQAPQGLAGRPASRFLSRLPAHVVRTGGEGDRRSVHDGSGGLSVAPTAVDAEPDGY